MNMAETKNKSRVYELDLIRVTACLMVVLMHSPMPVESDEPALQSLVALSTGYFCSPCIGLFFMVSGALLLPKAHEALPFLKRRLLKILCPTLIATLFYLAVSHIEKGGVNGLGHELLSIPFSAQGVGILWFMYTLIGLYLLAPILNAWLSASRPLVEIKLYFSIWLLTLCYPLIRLFADVNETQTGVLYYFSGYAGYFLLGYIMMHYPNLIRWRWLVFPALLSVISPIVCKLGHVDVDFYSVFWYLSIFVAIMCILWFKALLQWGCKLFGNMRSRSFIELVSNLSFGIYLTHFFIMRDVLWNIPFIKDISSYILQTATVFIFTSLLSFLICFLISLVRGSEYIIGWHYEVIRKSKNDT